MMKRTKTLTMRLKRRSASRARLILAVTVAVLLLCWNFPAPVHAADGDLDSGFAGGGKFMVDNGRNEAIEGIALQPDGKLVGVGYLESKKKGPDFVVGRLLPDGTPDLLFGSEGLAGVDFMRGEDVAYAVVIQSDGKIVALGEARNTSNDSADIGLARFNSDGSLDGSFGPDGAVLTDFFGRADHAFAAALQPDGKIVAVGFTESNDQGGDDFALARYNSNGSLDASFGSGGKVHTDFISGSRDVAYATVIQPDGKIIAAGTMSGNFGLARYNPNGSLDPSFGYNQDGKVNIDFAAHDDLAYSVALQSDGKILAGGYAFNQAGNNRDFALARFESNGTLDPSFGIAGRLTTDYFGGPDIVCALAIQPDDKIIATGSAWGTTGARDFALARYNDDGSLDASFGTGGKIQTDFLGNDDWAWAMALTPNGRVVLGGYASNGENADFAVACYKAFTVIPVISGVELRGKKLFVHGKNFDNGAALLMNGEPQVKTFNDETTPSAMLVARKSGKKIAPGETVLLQVRNSDGTLSNEFSFTRPVE